MPHSLAITLRFCVVMCTPSRVNRHIINQVPWSNTYLMCLKANIHFGLCWFVFKWTPKIEHLAKNFQFWNFKNYLCLWIIHCLGIKGRNVNLKMWAWHITHMIDSLCAILCSIITIQGYIQKQWGECELMRRYN